MRRYCGETPWGKSEPTTSVRRKNRGSPEGTQSSQSLNRQALGEDSVQAKGKSQMTLREKERNRTSRMKTGRVQESYRKVGGHIRSKVYGVERPPKWV